MKENSGSNSRVVEVINFLAAYPTESFTLSELASHLGLSNGSAHRVLTALTNASFLSRHPKHKTYSLGVALVGVGQAAMEQHPGVVIARKEISRLADELKGQFLVTVQVGDELLFVAREGVPHNYDGLIRVGERFPFVPPMGLGFVAWSDSKTVTAYLAEADRLLGSTVTEYLHTALEEIRKRGINIAALGKAVTDVRRVTTDPHSRIRDDVSSGKIKQLISEFALREIQLLDLEDVGADGISHLSAPVFSSAGDIVLELTASALPANLSVKEIELYISRLRASAAFVTAEIHGRSPRTRPVAAIG